MSPVVASNTVAAGVVVAVEAIASAAAAVAVAVAIAVTARPAEATAVAAGKATATVRCVQAEAPPAAKVEVVTSSEVRGSSIQFFESLSTTPATGSTVECTWGDETPRP